MGRVFKLFAFVVVVNIGLHFTALQAKNTLDYDTLNPKYYPYIVFYGDYSDEGIARVVEGIQIGERKTGLFIGILSGGLSQSDSNLLNFVYGVRLGYQSFLPSFFDRLSRPGVMGNRIYIQYYTSFSKQSIFGLQRFSNISLVYDWIIDLPILKFWEGGIIIGFGAGSSVHDQQQNSQFTLLLNMGVGTSFLKNHRLDFELKIIPSARLDWFGSLFTIGYSYVF